ncbi:ADYC domain-containing protein [Nannocystis bainbridge]|uniref:ADYC domain-containing protein n=1 Tax=Nannocystis bainbridge TaxID=2995303 RepID=A0ABT5DTM4_9BACT|nr:ADYC domain-containing protein [Nannocystis bainbridge]MDC0716981.1 ADYC domain-containing protein [Nannocystis bainbridge]
MTVVMTVCGGGCEDVAFEDVGGGEETRLRALHDNGVELNGTRFNGTRFNGTWFNGVKLVGASIGQGAAKSSLTGWSLVPGTSELQAVGNKGVLYRGEALEGARLHWLADDGGKELVDVQLKIVAVTQSADRPDIYFTDIDFRMNDGKWESVCTDGEGEPTSAIVVPGYFDTATADWLPGEHGELAFACRGTASAKCLEWGYRMWAKHGGISLADHYRACTRMVRADYCGTNVAHTENGTPIDVSDRLSPAILEPETDWAVEAEWGPHGAVCLNQPRKLTHSRAAVVAECQAAGRGVLPTCDAPGVHGLLKSQAAPS